MAQYLRLSSTSRCTCGLSALIVLPVPVSFQAVFNGSVQLDARLEELVEAVDDDVTLIGSANMDRRSFDLNYENNILLQDRDVTSAIETRQSSYLDDSVPVTLEDGLNNTRVLAAIFESARQAQWMNL